MLYQHCLLGLGLLLLQATAVFAQPEKIYRNLEQALAEPSLVYQLDLSDSLMQSMPSTIGAFSKLRSLTSRNNELVDIPDEICMLLELEQLDLSNNLILSLPACIDKLRKLERLDLSSNGLGITDSTAYQFGLEEILYLSPSIVPEAEIERIKKALPNFE